MRLAQVLLVRLVLAVVLSAVVGWVAKTVVGAVVLALVAVGLGAVGIVVALRMPTVSGAACGARRRCPKVYGKDGLP